MGNAGRGTVVTGDQKPLTDEQGDLDGPDLHAVGIGVEPLEQQEAVVVETLQLGRVARTLAVRHRQRMHADALDQKLAFAVLRFVLEIRSQKGSRIPGPGVQQFDAPLDRLRLDGSYTKTLIMFDFLLGTRCRNRP